MKFTGILVVLAASFLSSEAIINGQNFVSAPYIARVQYLTQQLAGGQGGGSVISHRHVLTSSFVLTANFVNLNVFIGGVTRASQRQVFVQTRISHPNYQANPRQNDIGIILLNADILFDRFVQPIAMLPNLVFAPLENEQGTALGFGGFPGQANSELFTEHLQAAFMRIVPPTRCVIRHPQHAVAQQFCAEDVRLRSDICSDDISGPLIVSQRGVDFLVGIASVHVCHVNQQVNPSEPSLFTRVSAYRTWITEHTQI